MDKLQAIFRGNRAREVHIKRYEDKQKISCPFLSSGIITEALVEFVEKEGLIQSHDIVYDIGCGNGDIMIALSKKFRCHTYGMDIDPVLIATAKRRAVEDEVQDLVHVHTGEAEKVNLKEPQQATVIYLFLIPHCLIHVSKIILASCPKGTTVIAYKYPMPEEDGWAPIKTCPCTDVLKPQEEEKIYLYKIR